MAQQTMKAVLLHAYGDVSQLYYEDAPMPVAAPGEVLVKTIATSINPIDWKLRRGDRKDQWPLAFPAILGRDISGEVVELGEGVTGFEIGDHVFGLVNRTYAEYVACKAEDLAKLPQGIDPIDAAALPLVLTTGTQVIELGVRPEPGQVVLVTGALGGVGRTAVYVARQHGARVIAGVRSSQKEEAETLGADRVIALDDANEVAALPELDAVADMVGHEAIDNILPHIRKNGVLASVVGIPASAGGRDLRTAPIFAKADPERLAELGRAVAQSAFSIPIAKKLKLSQIREAQQLAEAGSGGKIVLTP
jgi:NADPH:quinone reductase-like Zn-dependent oxidoreductase